MVDAAKTANLDLLSVDGRVRPAFAMAKRTAQEELEAAVSQYMAALGPHLRASVLADGAHAPADAVVVDVSQTYRRAADAVMPIMQRNGVFEPRHFSEMALPLRIAAGGQGLSSFKLQFRDGCVASTHQELVSLGRELVRETVGDQLMVRIAMTNLSVAATAKELTTEEISVVFTGVHDGRELQSLKEAILGVGGQFVSDA